MMYNEQQKQRYLDEMSEQYTKDYMVSIASAFNRISEFEEMYGKDACEFSREQISSWYSYTTYKDALVYANVNSRFVNYVNWCVNNNLVPDGCNHFSEFSVTDFQKYVNQRLEVKRYLTKGSFETICRSILNPRDEFLFRCLYEFGKSKNFMDIFEMELNDINQTTRKVKLFSGREVSVTQEFIDCAVRADAQVEYEYANPIMQPRKLRKSNKIFKKLVTNSETSVVDSNNKLMARVVKNIIDAGNFYPGINTSSIAVSGQFAMIRKLSREMGLEKKEIVLNYFELLKQQYEMSPNDPKKYWDKYSEFL